MNRSLSAVRWTETNCASFGKVAALVLLAEIVSCQTMSAQRQDQQSPGSRSLSDLALDNLNYVPASAPDLEEVLRRQPALLAELELWIASDATEHGQTVDESEMTQQGIFDRLEREQKFQAVAARLLERYGYLMPEVDPKSVLAQQHI